MCPKKPIILMSLVLTTALTASPGAAATFTVELPGLEGTYQGGGGNRTDNFDLGVSFISIDEVRIGWTGTITAWRDLLTSGSSGTHTSMP